MLSPMLNTIAAFAFAAFIAGWISALVIDRSRGPDGIGRRGFALIVLIALIAGTLAASLSWQRGEFQEDQTLEKDYELNR
jgi:MFS family permease|tara:strand:- start:169 stop:408 length:240 start_codon:yes stop_codon:yes gene_type:complete